MPQHPICSARRRVVRPGIYENCETVPFVAAVAGILDAAALVAYAGDRLGRPKRISKEVFFVAVDRESSSA